MLRPRGEREGGRVDRGRDRVPKEEVAEDNGVRTTTPLPPPSLAPGHSRSLSQISQSESGTQSHVADEGCHSFSSFLCCDCSVLSSTVYLGFPVIIS